MTGFVKKTFIFVVVMALVAATGWIGRKAYKRVTEQRLLARASQYLDQKDIRNAGLCLQRALQVDPLNVEASRLTADMLEAGGSPAALSWRMRTAQLRTNDVELRFAWAQTALRVHDAQSAAQALSGVGEPSSSSAAFHKLAGALAWNLNDSVVAEKHYLEALRLEPTNQSTVLNLATVRLGSADQSEAKTARVTLQQIPRNSPLHSTALRYLIADAVRQKALDQAVGYSHELVADTDVTFADKLAHLELLRRGEKSDYKSWRATMEETAKQSGDHVYEFAHWLALADGPAVALRWLCALPAAMQTVQPVPLVLTDCTIALGDWKATLALVDRKDWGEVDYYRCAIESLAERHLDQRLAAKNAWQKSLRLASHRLDRLARLNQTTGVWDWKSEKTEVLQEIVSEFPNERWAIDQLMVSLYADGDTRALGGLLARLHSIDPADNHLKNNLANICLLQKADLEKAHQMAREAYNSAPENPFFISTYAYSLLLQQKPDEAVKILGGLKTEYLKIPSVAAYYGVVEAQTGHKEIARESLTLAGNARLLPEEKEIVRLAQARL